MGKQSRMRREKIEWLLELRKKETLALKGRLYDTVRRETQSDYSEWLNNKGCVVVDATAIYEQIVASELFDICHNLEYVLSLPLRPAFNQLFIEWRYLSPNSTRAGIGFSLYPAHEDEGEFQDGELLFAGSVVVFSGTDRIYAANLNLRKYTSDTKWKVDFIPDGADYFEFTEFLVHFGLYVMALINCRNIELIDHEPDPEASRAYEHCFGQPLTKYKTLTIKPAGKRYKNNAESKGYQGVAPLHLRRGHPVTYTEDAPMLGKTWGVGTFWRPATAVGEEKNGVRVKDYKIEIPVEPIVKKRL